MKSQKKNSREETLNQGPRAYDLEALPSEPQVPSDQNWKKISI